MKPKVKIGLIILAAFIFSASFGYVVRQMVKGHEAENAFQSLSEQFSETESETVEDETEKLSSLNLEETSESFAGGTEEPLLLPVIKKPRKEWSEPAEETSTAVPEETSADSPSLGIAQTEPAAPTRIPETPQPSEASVTAPTTPRSPYYQGIQNCVGWLRIDGTSINYPVMQSKDDPEFYLHHAVSGEYSYPGVPFLEAHCEVGVSNHLVIYGHNMKNGTMFHDLRYYSSYSFWQSHRQIHLDTVDGMVVYEVMAVIQYNSDHDSFRFNAYTKMDADTFAWFVSQVKARQIYETGITAAFGDDMLTLSTCDWTYTNGRLLVIARRCRD